MTGKQERTPEQQMEAVDNLYRFVQNLAIYEDQEILEHAIQKVQHPLTEACEHLRAGNLSPVHELIDKVRDAADSLRLTPKQRIQNHVLGTLNTAYIAFQRAGAIHPLALSSVNNAATYIRKLTPPEKQEELEELIRVILPEGSYTLFKS